MFDFDIDHNIVFTPYIAAPEADTLDAVHRNEADVVACMFLNLSLL